MAEAKEHLNMNAFEAEENLDVLAKPEENLNVLAETEENLNVPSENDENFNVMASPEENLNMNAFEVEALKLAECPVCYEIFSPPAFQCANGHLICSNCLNRVNICPTCREEMPEQRIRSLAVEKLLSLKCQNLKWGCKTTLIGKNRENHELLCEYRARDYYCSRIGLKKLGIDCSKVVSKLDLPLHLKDEHKFTIIENNEALIALELDVENLNWGKIWFPVLFTAFDELFVLECQISSQSDSSGAAISWRCISAGSVSNAEKFCVGISLIPNDKSTSLKLEDEVISIDKIQEKVLNVFSLPMNNLNWKMNVSIQRRNSTPCIQNPVATVTNMTSVELLPPIYQRIEGRYQRVSSSHKIHLCPDEIVYSRNGAQWKRKEGNDAEYSFTFGQEVTFRYHGCYQKTTITIENNKLIHRRKENFPRLPGLDTFVVEEFADGKMFATCTINVMGFPAQCTAVFEKING